MDLHWRNTQKPARFMALDARAFAAVMMCIVHLTVTTLSIAAFIMFIFWVLERRGLTFEAALRAMRCWILGRRRPGLRPGQKRHWVDFG
jgi:intracellular multiplication protein IcmT